MPLVCIIIGGDASSYILTPPQLDISDDGFLNLMKEDGTPKDDVKLPSGEVGEKIERLFRTEEKDVSK